jgi:DNA modification methylase
VNWNGLELPDKNIYHVDDDVVIYCCDNREILPLLPDKNVDLVLTDPPYGVGKDYGNGQDDTFTSWVNLIKWLIPASLSIAPCLVFPTSKIEGEQWLWSNTCPTWRLCWYKGATDTRCSIGFKDWEPVFLYGRLNRQTHDFFFAQPTADYRDKHPCPKPDAFALWLISRLSNLNDLILDPFLGSGTTAVCAKKLGRKCLGVEIEEKYCKIAVERLRQSVMRLE